MNRHSVIVTIVLMAIAGLAVWTRNSSDHRPVAPIGSTHSEVLGAASAGSGNNSSKRRLHLVRPAPRTEDSITRLTVTTTEPAQLEDYRTVEAIAHRQLATLTTTLGLSAGQRQRVFPVLVCGADGFHPSMLVAGAPAGGPVESINDAICVELTPAQEATFQEALMDDTAWWDGAIAQLEAGLDEKTAPVSDSPLTDIESD